MFNWFNKNKDKKDNKEKEIKNAKEVKVEDSKTEVKEIGFFEKLKEGLDKTRKGMTDKIDSLLSGYGKIDEELFEEIEEILVNADVGINTTMEIIDNVQTKIKEQKIKESSEIKNLLREEVREILGNEDGAKLNIEPSPAVILVVGVNGVGKTTTIGKLAYNLKKDRKSTRLNS